MEASGKPEICRNARVGVIGHFRRVLITAAIVVSLFIVGCEQIDNLKKKDDNSAQTSATTNANSVPDTTSGTTNQTSTSTNNAEAAHGLVMANATVKGNFDFRNATITANMTGCTLTGSGVTLTWDPHTWPPHDGYTEGVICFIYKTGGQWVGGYFDWSPANTTGYSWGLGNIPNIGTPASGGECGFFILSANASQRSNVIFTTWP